LLRRAIWFVHSSIFSSHAISLAVNHQEGSALLSTERTFLHDGSISFDFTLLTENEEPLSFYIDGALAKQWNHTTMQGSSSFKASLRYFGPMPSSR